MFLDKKSWLGERSGTNECEDRVLPYLPDTVELIPTLRALPPRGGPVQDPVLTLSLKWRGGQI